MRRVLLRKQLVDADQGGLRLLKLLHLGTQRGQRPADQFAVAVHQPYRAQGQQPGPEQAGRHAQPDRHPADEHQRVGERQRMTGDLGGHLARQPVRQGPLEAGPEVALPAQRPQLFRCREPLAQPSEERGACRPAADEPRHAEGADTVHHDRAHHRERRHRCADAPILEPQHHHDAGRHEQVGGQLRQQIGQQAAQLGDVAVDTLQQGAGSRARKEGVPEIDRVTEQPAAQVIHRLPSQHGAGVGAHNLQHGPGYGDPDEQRRNPCQAPSRSTGVRQVQERPHHQRVGHLHRRSGHQRGDHHGEHRRPAARMGAKERHVSGNCRRRRVAPCSVTQPDLRDRSVPRGMAPPLRRRRPPRSRIIQLPSATTFRSAVSSS